MGDKITTMILSMDRKGEIRDLNRNGNKITITPGSKGRSKAPVVATFSNRSIITALKIPLRYRLGIKKLKNVIIHPEGTLSCFEWDEGYSFSPMYNQHTITQLFDANALKFAGDMKTKESPFLVYASLILNILILLILMRVVPVA